MIRGTVQPFKIILPCKNTELEWITIHFSQSNNPNRTLPIIKTKQDCGPRNEDDELDGTNILYVTLSAYDTTQFSDKYKSKMQLRAKPINGVEFGMPDHLITVYPMPDDLINQNPPTPLPTSDGWIIFDGDRIV